MRKPTPLSAALLLAFFLMVMPFSAASPAAPMRYSTFRYFPSGLAPMSNVPGGHVSVEGSGFLPTDTSCTLSSPSSPNLIVNGACVIQMGTGIAYGGFIIGNVLPGSYVVQITGNQGDSAQTVLGVE